MMTIEGIGALVVSIVALVTAFATIKKTRIKYSETIVDGFSKLLANYAIEVDRLSKTLVKSDQDCRTQLEERTERHIAEVEKIHKHYLNQIGEVNQKLLLLQNKVQEQEKTILGQANKISRLEARNKSEQ